MKRLLSIAFMVAVLAIMVVAEASALQIGITRVPGYYTGNGGEFTLTTMGSGWDEVLGNNRGAGYSFESFCLEKNEHLNIPSTVNAIINDEAILGGVNHGVPGLNGGGDVISIGTAWLYSQFAQGKLAGYNYTPGSGREASAGQLQSAIWWLEDELTLAHPNDNIFIAMVSSADVFGSYASAKEDNIFKGYGVAVLNLTQVNRTTGQTELRQDQLIFVPEPITLILLGIGLVGLAGARKRFKA